MSSKYAKYALKNDDKRFLFSPFHLPLIHLIKEKKKLKIKSIFIRPYHKTLKTVVFENHNLG